MDTVKTPQAQISIQIIVLTPQAGRIVIEIEVLKLDLVVRSLSATLSHMTPSIGNS